MVDTPDLSFWPNPSDTVFTLKLNSLNEKETVSIQVYDMNNKLVHSDKFDPNAEYRFGERLRGGVYIAKVTLGNVTRVVRLVKY